MEKGRKRKEKKKRGRKKEREIKTLGPTRQGFEVDISKFHLVFFFFFER